MNNRYVPNFKELDKLTKDGYLRKVISPCSKLCLYNYTNKCTYEQKWNKHTLNSRGTVYEIESGNIIAKAFKKFFNFSQLSVSKQRNLLKSTEFSTYEKYDGSMGVVYYYEGKWRVNTRGSFTSDQAIKATEMLSKYDMSKVATDYTLICEIIYPENRVIVDYGEEEKLVLLAAFDSEWGFGDQPYEILENISEGTKLELANPYNATSIAELVSLQEALPSSDEGFVVRFNTGERVKFKSLEYLKIAKIVSNMTPLNFWKNMKDGIVDIEIIREIPDEFRSEALSISESLQDKYHEMDNSIRYDFNYVIKTLGGLPEEVDDEFKKELGLFLKNYGDEIQHSGAMFGMILKDRTIIDKYIMKKIKPKANCI